MAFADKLTVVIDFVTGPATSGLGKLRTEVKQAEGAFGKMQVVGSAAFQAVKDNAAEMALLAGAALVQFGRQAVSEFQKTALEAGKFSEATGTAVEEASRWIEVGGDLGIGADKIEGAMMRLNKALGANETALAEYGVEIVRADNGTIDANATFERAVTTIGAIEDPTRRAQAAQEAFGRGYGEIAVLMGMSADELRRKLQAVSQERVITKEELDRARGYQAALEDLKDVVGDLEMALGQALVPALTDAAEGAVQLFDAFSKVDEIAQDVTGQGVADWASDLVSPFGVARKAADELTKALGTNVTASEALDYAWDYTTGNLEKRPDTEYLEDLARDLENAKNKTDNFGMAVDAVDPRLDQLKTGMDDARNATRELNEAYDRLTEKLRQAEVWDEFSVKMYEYRSSTDQSEASTREYIGALADTVVALDDIPDETKARLITELEQGAIDEVERELAHLSRLRTIKLKFGNVTDVIDRVSQKSMRGISSALSNVSLSATIDEATAAAMFETGAVSAAEYKRYLTERLNSFKEHSRDYMRVFRELESLKRDEARSAKDAAEDAADAEAERVDAAYKAAAAQLELAKATQSADQIWSEWWSNLQSDPGNWAGRQDDLNRRFADSLLRRADAQANAQGIEDGTVEWARFVRAALERDKATAPVLTSAIDMLLKGIPVLHSGGQFQARNGREGLALLEDGETVRTTQQEAQLQGALAGRAATYSITVNAGMGADGGEIGKQLVKAIRDYEARSGKGWRS